MASAKAATQGSKVIKFRAWDKVRRYWVYGTLTNNPKMFYMEWDNGEFRGADSEIEPWLQFTTLHDKNGKEVYEGDILRWEGPKEMWGDDSADEFVVEFRDGQFLAIWAKGDDPVSKDFSELQVIGNIYENIDLLKEAA